MEKNVIYKRLIKHRLPLKEVSTESAREKSIRHGHISTLHIWWARRPLAASRAAVFATLVPDTTENYDLVKKIVHWEAVKDGNNSDIILAKKVIANQNEQQPPKLLDPFGGGGAIPLEALRLGCETYCLDINPVAHIIQKATLEFPQLYGQKDSRSVPSYILEADLKSKKSLNSQHALDFNNSNGQWQTSYKINPLLVDVKYWSEIILERVKNETNKIYPADATGKIPVAYLWARTVVCSNPQCRAEIPMVRQWWLAKKDKKSIALKPTVSSKTIDFTVVSVEKGESWPEIGTMNRDNVTCLVCGNVTGGKHLRMSGKEGSLGERMIAVVLSDPNSSGKSYRAATEVDERAFILASEELKKFNEYEKFDNISIVPDEPIIEWSGVFNAPLYGLNKWGKLFNSRQLLTMLTFVKHVRSIYTEIRAHHDDAEYARAVVTYLGICIDKLADYNSTLCRWANHGEYIGNTFSRQALPMVWDYAETVPIVTTSGNWEGAVDWGTRVIDHAALSSAVPARVLRGSATRIPLEDNYLDAIVTDPPYYDAVPYADLSDFFYVWLRRSIGHLYPEHFRTPTTPKSQEATQNPMRHKGNNIDAKLYFEDMMSKAFQEMHRVLKPTGDATIVFAHKSTEAWETLITAIIAAGFKVEASWPLRTEMETRMRAQGSAALASSTFLNCTKRLPGNVGYFNDVRREMNEAIKPQIKEFWDSGIRGADFFMSAIGPGLESYSKYDEVRKMSGEPVLVGEFLDEVRKIVLDFALSQVLGAAATGAVDHPTQFAVLGLWAYGLELPSDEARKLAQSVGLELSFLGSLIKISGDKAKMLSIKDREKASKNLGVSEAGSVVPMIDAIHKAVLMLPEGRQKIANYLAGVGYLDQEVFWQTMQAVAEVLEGEADGRSMHELLTIRDNLPKGETGATQGSLGF